MWASFHDSGNLPSIIDLLNMIFKGVFIELESSFSIRGWKPSGLADLVTFNLFNFFSTRSGVIIISVRVTFSCRSFIMGMVFVSSLVNTLVKYLFPIPAFSWSSLVRFPSSFCISFKPGHHDRWQCVHTQITTTPCCVCVAQPVLWDIRPAWAMV